MSSTQLQGVIINVSFKNDDTGFKVLKLQPIDSITMCTCIGTMPTLEVGESVVLFGTWIEHVKYGNQFSVQSYQIVKPTTINGISQLLSSGLFESIGPARAKLIIEKFGLDTIDVLDTAPERLKEIPGIGKKTIDRIKKAWEEKRLVRDLMLFLQEYGVSPNLVSKIYKAYGNDAQTKISQNPYILIDDVWGVGFIKADAIAQKMGIPHDSYKRIRAGLQHTLQEASSEGHTFLTREELCKSASEILGVSDEKITFSLDHALNANIFTQENSKVYLPLYYKAEIELADFIHTKMAQKTQTLESLTSPIQEWLENYQKRTGWQGDPKQIEAVKLAVRFPILLITGGPGTGKTSVLQVIVSFLRERQYTIALCAPTGRAAQRMGTIAGITAKTIHRLLEYKPGGGSKYSFLRTDENPIEADVIIVDEMSMVDLLLARSFFKAISPKTSIICVGDDNQLPSVGAGSVLKDLISSSIIPHIHLTTIFRQAAASRIVTSAHEIINGQIPSYANSHHDNCFFLIENEPEHALETIIELVTKRLPSKYNYDPIRDIQILSPMHKGVVGTENLNIILQKTFHPKMESINRGPYLLSKGDKVMQIKNNYDLEVWNGDIGIIRKIDGTKVTVDYNGIDIVYQNNLDEIIPAYCISIHKSQGCEFPAVIIPLMTQHFIMLQRNLFYTAITRARELCILIGNHKALSIAVKNDKAAHRNSGLEEKLKNIEVISFSDTQFEF